MISRSIASLSIAPSPTERQRFRRQPLVGGRREIEAIVEAVSSGRCCRFIGPRYHHKSQVMRAACGQVDKLLGYTSIYISMWDARTTSESAFFASIGDLVAARARKFPRRRTPRSVIHSAADLTLFLTALSNLLRNNVALFVDDLDAVPPHYLGELLRVLRAVYQTASIGLRFIAVVCATHSLARAALGPTSPFENISSLVTVNDLTRNETHELARRLVSRKCSSPTQGALELIHEQTGGDRTLVSEVCQECCRLLSAQQGLRITRDLVRAAVDSLVTHGGRKAVTEGLQQIENDPDLLRVITRLMHADEISASELSFYPTIIPNPLITSGFVHLHQGRYRIKSDLHRRLLAQYFSAERVGQIFLAAGNWHEAIDFLGGDISQIGRGTAEERAHVMLAAISAIYSVPTKHEAYAYLAHGLKTTYPRITFSLYDLEQGQNTLMKVYELSSGTNYTRAQRISLNAFHRPETRAATDPQEYLLQPVGRRRMALYVPLRLANEATLGLAVVDGFVTQHDFRRKHEQILELVGYLRHAARALHNRVEYQHLNDATAQRAQDLEHLLTLTRDLMSTKRTYDEVLNATLESARRALSRQAQMGSIYLYDRKTGTLTMRADSGYPTSVRTAAKFSPGQGLAGYVYKTGKPWNVPDTAADKHYQPIPSASRFQVRSTIGVPLVGRYRRPLGVLCLDNLRRTDAFDPQSVQLLTLFAGQVARWLENARWLEVLRDLNAAIAEMRDSSHVDLLELFDLLAERLIRSFDLSGCAVGLSTEFEQVRFVARRGLPRLPKVKNAVDLPARLVEKVLQGGQVLPIADLSSEADDWSGLLGHATYSSVIVLPLTGENGQPGFMLLVSIGEFDPLDEELDILTTFANQVSIALMNIGLRRHLASGLSAEADDTGQAASIDYISDSRAKIEVGARDIHEAEENWPTPDVLIPQMYDLLSRAFRGANSLWVERKVKGLSGSVVFEIYPTWSTGGIGQPFIVKIGRRDKTATEEANYRKHVEPFLVGNHATQLSAQYSQHLGALKYTLAGTKATDVIEFEQFYERHTPLEIINVLRSLFRITCAPWYEGRSAPELKSLRDLYLEAFNLHRQPNRLSNEIKTFYPEFDPLARTLSMLGKPLLNPLHWLKDNDPSVMPVRRSITHGDLHARNILIDKAGNCFLIDFYRTTHSHILRDFAVLEADIKFHLLGALTPRDFYQFEQFLLQIDQPANGVSTAHRLPPAAKKAAEVILGLRAEAWRLFEPVEQRPYPIHREYLLSLLMTTLNILRLRHFKEDPMLQPRRELALLSAGMICQHLQ